MKDTFISHHNVEIKLFPGLKVAARYITPEESRSNFNIAKKDFILSLNASFSDHFKQEVRRLHQQAQ